MQIFVDGVLRGSFDGKTHSEATPQLDLGYLALMIYFLDTFLELCDCIIYSEALDDATIQTQMSENAYPASNNLCSL